ncbi:hypothetical protein [Streptomyces lydicus]
MASWWPAGALIGRALVELHHELGEIESPGEVHLARSPRGAPSCVI